MDKRFDPSCHGIERPDHIADLVTSLLAGGTGACLQLTRSEAVARVSYELQRPGEVAGHQKTDKP
jgi:hypothetical protein